MANDSLGQTTPNLQLHVSKTDTDNFIDLLKLGFQATLESPTSAYHEGFYNAVKSLIFSGLKCLQGKNSPEFKEFLHAIKIIESIPVIILIQNDSALVSKFSHAANKLRHLDENIDTVLRTFEQNKAKNNTK